MTKISRTGVGHQTTPEVGKKGLHTGSLNTLGSAHIVATPTRPTPLTTKISNLFYYVVGSLALTLEEARCSISKHGAIGALAEHIGHSTEATLFPDRKQNTFTTEERDAFSAFLKANLAGTKMKGADLTELIQFFKRAGFNTVNLQNHVKNGLDHASITKILIGDTAQNILPMLKKRLNEVLYTNANHGVRDALKQFSDKIIHDPSVTSNWVDNGELNN